MKLLTKNRLVSLTILLWMMVILVDVAAVQGQGTMGMLPNPISSRELTTYFDRLGMSEQQCLAVYAFHDQYKREFRVLHESEITIFMKELSIMEGGTLPERKRVENLFKNRTRLLKRIASIDDRLMDQMQTILTDEQAVKLPRVKLARERTRLTSQLMMAFMGGRPPYDLSEPFLELDLSQEEFAAADPVIEQYERRLTTGVREINDSFASVILRMYDAMDEMGLGEENFEDLEEDPEKAEEIMETMQQIMMEIMAETQKKSKKLKELNRRTYNMVADLLEPPSARKLRNQFYQNAYGQSAFALENYEPWINVAADMEDLTEPQRQAVTEYAQLMQEKSDKVAEEAVKLISEFEENMNPFDYDMELWQEHFKNIGELQSDLTVTANEAMNSLRDTLGEELTTKLTQNVRKAANREQAEDTTEVVTREIDDSELQRETRLSSGDYYLPNGIGRRELHDYLQPMDLSDAEKALVDALHEDYLLNFDELKETKLESVSEANNELWEYDEDTESVTPPTEKQVRDLYRLRSEAMDAVLKLDQSFFSDLAILFTDNARIQQVQRAARSRLRHVYRSVQEHIYTYNNNESSRVDLTELIGQLNLTSEQFESIEEVMTEYEIKSADLIKRKYEIMMNYQKTSDIWSAEVTRLQQEGEFNALEIGRQYQQRMGTAREQVSNICEEIIQQNQQSMVQLTEQISGYDESVIRREYSRMAYPSVYEDEASVTGHLTRAFQLNDLTEEQRRRLEEIAAEYRPAYASYCQQLVDLGGELDWWRMEAEDAEAKDYFARQQELATIKFDRDELSARTASALARVLREEQVRAIGGLPEPPESTGPWDY